MAGTDELDSAIKVGLVLAGLAVCVYAFEAWAYGCFDWLFKLTGQVG